MANSESLRHFLIGREAVTGTLAATMTAIPFLSASNAPKKARVMPKEFRGTRVLENAVRSGVQSSEIKLKMLGYYDLLGWVLACAFNAPTDATNDTTAYDHTFKTGANSVPANSLQYSYGVGTAAEIWEESLGAMVDQIDFSFAADKLVEVDVTWVGPLGAVIVAPTVPAYSIASYVQPFGLDAQASVTINGSGFTKLISGKVSVKNNRAPLYTINASADPSRFIEGPVQVTWDLEVDFTASAGSLYNDFLTTTSPGAIVYKCQDTTNLIGATTAYPTFQITLPKPEITAAELKPDSKGNTTASIKGVGLYDTSSSSACTALLTNVIAAYPGS